MTGTTYRLSTTTAIRWTRKVSCLHAYLAEPAFYRMFHDKLRQPTRKTCSYCGGPLRDETGAFFVVPWRRDGRYVEHYRDALRHFTTQDRADAFVCDADDDSIVVRWLDQWQIEQFGGADQS